MDRQQALHDELSRYNALPSYQTADRIVCAVHRMSQAESDFLLAVYQPGETRPRDFRDTLPGNGG